MAHLQDDVQVVSLALVPASQQPGIAGLRPAGQIPIVPAKLRSARAGGLRRLRLEEALESGLWERRLALVAAPAGSGKTTLLAQFALAAALPCAWYQAEASDGEERVLLAYLEASLRQVLPQLAGGWSRVEDAARALEACPERVLLVVDDLHLLEGTPAEAAFEQFLTYRPPSLAILAACRRYPASGLLSRLRLSGDLLVLGADDLRFRTWEVERLFTDHYRRRLLPEEAGELARRTEGWAAGLQMFHLATAAKTPGERRQTLTALGGRTRLAREYLARNVLDDLPAPLRRFLVETCVLSRLSGPLCDELLHATGSEALLAELERRQVFTVALEFGGYRYHEALRAHLEGVMREELGPAEAQRHYQRAGALLERSGHATDAVQAYCRAEDWTQVARMLGREGESLTTRRIGEWLGLLPPGLGSHDPWVLLATARRLRAVGRWVDAVATYRAAEQEFASQSGSESGLASAAGERLSLSSWLEGEAPATDWSGAVRWAAFRSPTAAAARSWPDAGARGQLAAGLVHLIAGDLMPARAALVEAVRAEDASPELVAGAILAGAVVAALGGDPAAKDLAEAASRRAEAAGLPWLARLSQATLALTYRPDGRSEAAALRLFSRAQNDPWGPGLAGLLEGLGELRAGGCRWQPLEEAAQGFSALGALPLEAWCECIRAALMAAGGDPAAREVAERAAKKAKVTGLRAPWALAQLTLCRLGNAPTAEIGHWLTVLRDDCGFIWLGGTPETAAREDPSPVAATPAPPAPAPPSPAEPLVRVRCFGGFRLEVGGVPVRAGGLKPRARKLLHLLGLEAGKPVHREVLIEALWPLADPEVGTRNLHVAISLVRQFLQAEPCAGALIVAREGEDYRLEPAGPWEVDVARFEGLVEEGRRRIAAGDPVGAIAAFRAALGQHTGDLLPEDGPEEWVVPARDRFRALAVEISRTLAGLLLGAGDLPGAARACELGLAIDQNRDDLWRALRQAHEAAGNHAAAASALRRYEQVLEDLGIP